MASNNARFLAECAQRAKHMSTVLAVLLEALETCGLGLYGCDGSSLQQLIEPSELEISLAAEAMGQDYTFASTDVRHPQLPSFYKTIVEPEWSPVPGEDLSGIPEAARWYNRRWIPIFRVTYEAFHEIREAVEADLMPERLPGSGGVTPIMPAEQLAICLYHLAQGGQYKGAHCGLNRWVLVHVSRD